MCQLHLYLFISIISKRQTIRNPGRGELTIPQKNSCRGNFSKKKICASSTPSEQYTFHMGKKIHAANFDCKKIHALEIPTHTPPLARFLMVCP